MFNRYAYGLGDLEPHDLARLALDQRSALLDSPHPENIADAEADQCLLTALLIPRS